MSIRPVLHVALIAALTLGAGACGKRSTEPKAQQTVYVGTMAGSSGGVGVSGSMTVDLAAATPTGTLTISGTPIALTGTYDAASEAVTLSGGGYTFSGTRTGTIVSGIFTSGPITGGFVLTAGASPRVYCGTSASATPGGPTGTLNLVITGSTVVGLAVDAQTGEVLVLSGTLIGTAITIPNPGDPNATFATGTHAPGPDTASGTYDDGAGDAGTWNATRC